MSTLDPSDVPCLPCQQGYDKAHVCDIPDYCPCDQRGKHSAGDLMSVYDFSTVLRIKVVPADSIVLDPENFYVRGLLKLNEQDWNDAADAVADMIRAQIAPPEPPMEEPTALGEKVKTDNGVAVIADDQSGHPWYLPSEKTWHHWGQLKNPRPYESPRQEPATAPQSDAQGSGSGIGRVSESEAVEGALDLVVYLNETTAAALEELAAKIKAAANEKDSL